MKIEEFSPQILVADRNPHVRNYLKRELLKQGYRVLLARSCREVIVEIEGIRRVDVLVLDPDLPGADADGLSRKLQSYLPSTPLILHTLEHRRNEELNLQFGGIIVEKTGDSVEQILAALEKLLPNHPPAASDHVPECKIS